MSNTKLYIVLHNKYKHGFPPFKGLRGNVLQPKPIICACQQGSLDDIKVFVDNHNVEETKITTEQMINQKGIASNGSECTPMFAAASMNRKNVVDYLLEKGANIRDKKAGVISRIDLRYKQMFPNAF